MSITVNLNGIPYRIPVTGEVGWGQEVTNYLVALSTGLLSLEGGNFPLMAEVNFGPNNGVASPYFRSGQNLAAVGGVLRLTNSESVHWRNAANTADIILGVNPSGDLIFNGLPIAGPGSGAANVSITSDNVVDAIVYPTWVSANSGNLPVKVSDTKLTFHPLSGTLGASTFTGGGTGLTGHAANLTVGMATAVANNVIFTNSGGAAVGTSFNGSVPRTISFATVGAPSTTGVGATGTWNVSINGVNGTFSNIVQVGVAPTGRMILAAGTPTESGYISFIGSNGLRQGYIGNSQSSAATDNGIINYQAADHNFSGKSITLGTITSGQSFISNAGSFVANHPGENGALRFSTAGQGLATGSALFAMNYYAVSPTFRDITIMNADAIGVLMRHQCQYDANTAGSEQVFTTAGQLYHMPNNGQGFSTGGWVAFSDRRVKENLAVIPDALAKIGTLSGYTYNRNDMPDNPRKAGYIAQEIQAILPEGVSTLYEKGVDRLAVDHNAVIGLLIEAVKELKAEIELLKSN